MSEFLIVIRSVNKWVDKGKIINLGISVEWDGNRGVTAEPGLVLGKEFRLLAVNSGKYPLLTSPLPGEL